MYSVVQPEGSIEVFLNEVLRLLGIQPKALTSVKDGFADAGTGEGWKVQLKTGEELCVAPNPNEAGWIVSHDGKKLYAKTVEEIESRIRELCQ